MKKVIKSTIIPKKSTITDQFGRIDYQDVYKIKKQTNKSAEEISRALTRLPAWVEILFKSRDRIAGVFGLKTNKNISKQGAFFTVIENREDEIVMGEEDKHLNFKSSLLKNSSENSISLITIVHFNNVWGKFYFLFIKPFHKIIMKTLLKRFLLTRI